MRNALCVMTSSRDGDMLRTKYVIYNSVVIILATAGDMYIAVARVGEGGERVVKKDSAF